MANSPVNENYIINCVYTREGEIRNIASEIQEIYDSLKTTVLRSLEDAKDYCDKDSLSVNNTTLEKDFEEIINELQNKMTKLLDFSETLNNNRSRVSTNQKKRIDQYLEELKSQNVKAETNSNNNTYNRKVYSSPKINSSKISLRK